MAINENKMEHLTYSSALFMYLFIHLFFFAFYYKI